MTSRTPLDDFLAYELDDSIRSDLLGVIAELQSGQQRFFTYNTFNVLLDADAATATVEDELDVERESTLSLDAFAALLRSSQAAPREVPG